MAKKKAGKSDEAQGSRGSPESRKGEQGVKKAADKGGSWYELLIHDDVVETLVAETADINRTASLYSRTDLYKCMTDFQSNLMSEGGFPEYTFWMDLRLFLCIVASAIASWTIANYKFPADKDILFWMVLVYFMVAALVAIIDTTKTGNDNFYVSMDLEGNALFFCIHLDDFSDHVEMEVYGGKKEESSKKKVIVSKYFDEDGYLVHDSLFNDFCELIDSHLDGGLLQLLEHYAETEGGEIEMKEFTEGKKKK